MSSEHYTYLKFVEGLRKKYGISHDTFVSDYFHCGSSTSESTKAKRHGITKNIIKLLNTDQCLCGVKIKENVYFMNKKNFNNIIVIGNICKKRYIQESDKSSCLICFKPHQNHKYNYCNECKKEYKKTKKRVDKKDKKNFEELNDYVYIPWEAMRPDNEYCYTVNKYRETGRKVVKFKCLKIDNDKITCLYDGGYIREILRMHKFNKYIFYQLYI